MHRNLKKIDEILMITRQPCWYVFNNVELKMSLNYCPKKIFFKLRWNFYKFSKIWILNLLLSVFQNRISQKLEIDKFSWRPQISRPLELYLRALFSQNAKIGKYSFTRLKSILTIFLPLLVSKLKKSHQVY